MASPTGGTPHRDPDDTPLEGGRLVTERTGAGGVSDQRRAELEQLEADAGTVGDNAQQSRRPQPGQPDRTLAGGNATPPIHAYGTGQDTNPATSPNPVPDTNPAVNPDIDKR